MVAEQRDLFTIPEVAAMLSLRADTIWKKIRSGEIPESAIVRLPPRGRNMRIRRAWVESVMGPVK